MHVICEETVTMCILFTHLLCQQRSAFTISFSQLWVLSSYKTHIHTTVEEVPIKSQPCFKITDFERCAAY